MKGNERSGRRAGRTVKRLLSMILSILVLLTCLPLNSFADQTKGGMPFTDVKESSWYYDAVKYVYSKGIFAGTTKTTFSPDSGMTRAMFVTTLGKYAKVDTSTYSGTGGFSDVDPDAYYAPYVAWASEKGITAGVGGGRFDTNGLVTREQIAVFVTNYFNVYNIKLPQEVPGKTPPRDLQAASEWAKTAVQKLWNVGIFSGDLEGRFNPRSTMLRSEAAQFYMKMDYVLSNKTDPTPGPSETPPGPGGDTVYTVTFNTSGGPSVSSVQVQSGGTIASVPQPAREGYVFAGWYTDAGFTQKFDESRAITANLTLYARYIDLGAPVEKQSYDENVQLPEVVEDDPVKEDFAVTVNAPGLTLEEVKAGLQMSVMSGMDDRAISVTGSSSLSTVK